MSEERGKIIAFPGADSAADGARHLLELASQPGAVASLFAVVYENGTIELRVFGDLKISQMALVGAIVSHGAVREYYAT